MSVPLADLEGPSNYVPQQRQPGDFHRRGENGPPYVARSDGKVKKAGEAVRDLYSRPSSYGDLIEDKGAIYKWLQRNVVLGVGIDPELAETAKELVGGDIDDKAWRAKADALVARALDASKFMLAAERGTNTHGNVEDTWFGRDPEVRRLAGEMLGMSEDVQKSLLDTYHATMAANGIEIVAVELSVVNDEFRAAGKLDAIGLCTKDLRFRFADGTVKVIPAGTYIVCDLKTGKLRRHGTNDDGPPMYWEGYAIQVYLYASAVVYDTETDKRTPFAWPVSQEHALIVHLDNLAAIKGEPKCELVYLDLAQGRTGCEVVVAAKKFSRSRTIFSVAQIDDEQPQVESVPVEVAGSALVDEAARAPLCVVCHAAPASEAIDMLCVKCNEDTICPTCRVPILHGQVQCEACAEDAAIQAVADAMLPRRAAIQAKMDALKQFSAEAALQALGEMRMRDLPTLKQSDQHSDNELEAIDLIVMQCAANAGVPFGPPFDVQTEPARPAWLHESILEPVEKPTPAEIIGRPVIDEGAALSDADAAAIAEAYKAAPEIVRSQCSTWKREASDAGYSANLNDLRSVRRFAITRAMMAAATLGAAVTDVDERAPLLRRALLIVTGEQFPANTDVPIGACLGALTTDEADRFCELSYEIFNDVERHHGEPARSIPDDLAARYRRAA